MARTKISEFSATPANNTDIDSINIAENCPPSGINDAIRELMAQLKDFQQGTAGDSFNGPVGTTTAAAGAFTTLSASGAVTLSGGTANGVPYLNGSKVLTTGSALTFDGSRIALGTATSNIQLTTTVNTNQAYISLADADGRTAVFRGPNSGAPNCTQIGSVTNHDVAFLYGNTEQMRLTSTGLGIGTSSPHSSAKLHVYAAGDYTDESAPFTIGSAATGDMRLYAGVNNTSDYTYIGSVRSGQAYGSLVLQPNGGNLGLGVTPSAWRTTEKALQIGTTGSVSSFSNATVSLSQNTYTNTSSQNIYLVSSFASSYLQTSGQHRWYTAPSGTAGNAISFTQVMTLGSSGELIIGNTTRAQTAKLTIQAVANAPKFGVGPLETSSSNFFVVNGSGTGVYLADGATSWTANSDERLKDIIEPIQNAAEKVANLRAVIGKYKTDKSNVRRAFLIAQDVQAVLPEAVVSTDPDSLGVMYTDTIPLLVAAFKELKAEFDLYKASHP